MGRLENVRKFSAPYSFRLRGIIKSLFDLICIISRIRQSGWSKMEEE